MSFKTFFAVVVAVCLTAGLLTFLSSRGFIEDSDAVTAAELAGYKDARVESQHYALPNRFGCKTADAIAYVVSATHAGDMKRERVTVCCGAWFSGCAVRVEAAH